MVNDAGCRLFGGTEQFSGDPIDANATDSIPFVRTVLRCCGRKAAAGLRSGHQQVARSLSDFVPFAGYPLTALKSVSA